MAGNLLNLKISEHAGVAYSSLGPDDRRRVDAWFDHLRNWRNDEFTRSRTKRLDSCGETYVIQTSSDILIAFEISGDDVTVLSIFRKEALRAFEMAAGRTAT